MNYKFFDKDKPRMTKYEFMKVLGSVGSKRLRKFVNDMISEGVLVFDGLVGGCEVYRVDSDVLYDYCKSQFWFKAVFDIRDECG